jgi:hypothetical protein
MKPLSQDLIGIESYQTRACCYSRGGVKVQHKDASAGHSRENDAWSHKVREAGFTTAIHWVLELEQTARCFLKVAPVGTSSATSQAGGDCTS